jgi:NAD(P)-dependent dehydrogenase (short-subunit alcohol dehydrogenase family)
MLSRQLAVEWGSRVVRRNVVSPGMIRTPMTETIYQAAGVHEARRALVPVRRTGRPEDIADTVVFLASERASYEVFGRTVFRRAKSTHHYWRSFPRRPGR